MGLFDMLGFAPNTQKNIGGFLEMLQGLQSPDNPFRQAREQQQAQQMMQQERDWQTKVRERQQQQWQQEDQMRSLPGQFMKPAQMPPTMDARDIGQPGEPSVGKQFDMQGYIDALKGIDPIKALQLEASLRKEQPQPIKLGTNERLVDPLTGKVTLDAVPDQAKDDQFVRLMKAAGIDPQSPRGQSLLAEKLRKESTQAPGVSVSYGAPQAGVDSNGNPVFFQPSKGGGAPAIVPGIRPADSTKPPTEFEAKAGLYFKSMQTASQTLDDIEQKGGWRPGMAEAIVPGTVGKSLAQSETRQKYTQAQKQWIDSINRVRSGANLPELEYERAVATFFPIFGEGESIRAQKAAARKQEEAAMADAAGKALPKNRPGNTLKFDANGNMVN